MTRAGEYPDNISGHSVGDDLPPANRNRCHAAAGPAYDRAVMRLSLLASLVWLGRIKDHDAAEHPDAVMRARKQQKLGWWLKEARLTLDAGMLSGLCLEVRAGPVVGIGWMNDRLDGG